MIGFNIIILYFIYNAPVPVLQKRASSTVQLHISGSIHGKEIHAIKNKNNNKIQYLVNTVASDMTKIMTN